MPKMRTRPAIPLVTLALLSWALLLSCSGTGYTPLGWEGLPSFPAGTVAFYGDSRTGDDAHREIVAGMMRTAPVAVLHSGDLVEDGGDPAQWENFAAITGSLRALAPMLPARGNHDTGGTLFADFFSLPASTLWFAADAGDAHVMVLDSLSSLDPGSPQLLWLEAHLASLGTSRPLRVALFHYPLFSTGRHGGDELGQRAALEPLFETYGVDLVVSGHDHDYERTVHDGVTYLVSGGGGAPLYSQETSSAESVTFASVHHFGVLFPTSSPGGGYRVEVWSPGATLVDAFDISP